jgi:hypothetical protein
MDGKAILSRHTVSPFNHEWNPALDAMSLTRTGDATCLWPKDSSGVGMLTRQSYLDGTAVCRQVREDYLEWHVDGDIVQTADRVGAGRLGLLDGCRDACRVLWIR